MHIPDGMLDTKTVAVTIAASGGTLAYGVRRLRATLAQERVVLMSVMAALVFALQMLNFPVAGGTSGHFAGGAAAAIVLGPWPAVVVVTVVLLVQALVFADGGVLALGANVLNMAVIGPFVGWAIYSLVVRLRSTRSARVGAAFAAAWAAGVASALAAAVEIWASGRADILLVTGAMALWHAAIGIGEGLITAGLVGYLAAVRPDLLERPGTERAGETRGVTVVLGVAALAAAGMSFLASTHPDGLESVYFEQGIGERFAEISLVRGLAPGYALPGVPNGVLAGILAGVVGVVMTGVLLYSLASGVRRRKAQG